MSNATQDSRNPGERRRRRSRGGQNRRNHQNRGERGQRDGNKQARAEEFRPQGNRPPRKYAPPKLTWWQKLLKAIGLYKEPVRPPRPERKPDVSRQAQGGEARVKSNTRNARSADGQQAQGEKRERGERSERSGRNRDNNRSRGGDADTVESSRVYVGNLSYDVTESDLIDLFKGIGGVRNVEIVYNRTTHRSKGYGFVEMLHVDEAKRAVEVLHDQPFMGRKMIVSGAKSKGQDEREDREDRPERAPREPRAAAPAEAPAVEETVTHLQDPTPAEIVEAAVENTEAAGAPEVIVEAVEHQVAEAVDTEPAAGGQKDA